VRASPRQRVRRRTWRRLGITVGFLAAYNVVGNLFLPSAWYVPANLAAAAVVWWLARRDGLGLADAGLALAHAGRGARLGLGTAALVAAVIAAGAFIRATRSWFVDERAVVDSAAALLFQVLIRVPLGTVVLEEIAFRGVLPAMFEQHGMTPWRAVWASAALFGLWHVIPAYEGVAANAAINADGPLAKAVAVGLACLSTVPAGLVFSWLRIRSDSLVAPFVGHWSTNGFSYLAAYAVAKS
jgi:membrane protease YdiL (CAAX protease family)